MQRLEVMHMATRPLASRLGLILLSFGVALPCAAQAVKPPVTVPFVGCPADGQTGPSPAPEGPDKVVEMRDAPVGRIAYYEGESCLGVFAPRGWNCRVTFGSGGCTTLASPEPLDPSAFPQPPLRGPAVSVEYRNGGTSGRFGVASYAAQLFPEIADAFIKRVKAEGMVPAEALERRPYADDVVTYPARGVARFFTPANKAGLGTETWLIPSNEPVRGIAELDDVGDWGMTVFRMRLSPELRALEDTLMQLNAKELLSRGE
jgi:hypothetical protein